MNGMNIIEEMKNVMKNSEERLIKLSGIKKARTVLNDAPHGAQKYFHEIYYKVYETTDNESCFKSAFYSDILNCWIDHFPQSTVKEMFHDGMIDLNKLKNLLDNYTE